MNSAGRTGCTVDMKCNGGHGPLPQAVRPSITVTETGSKELLTGSLAETVLPRHLIETANLSQLGISASPRKDRNLETVGCFSELFYLRTVSSVLLLA